MPKRPSTPPPNDDEPRYLTVVHPYPLHAHWELDLDRQNFARWFSCCIRPDMLYTFYYKPSARNTVIVEVARDQDFATVLGEHKWSEFLRNPTEEEKPKSTKVFFCQHNTGRLVEKSGWKPIKIQESWFFGWSPKNRLIVFPYPKTHHCEVPIEDRTNVSLCRHLPHALFPPTHAPSSAVGGNNRNKLDVLKSEAPTNVTVISAAGATRADGGASSSKVANVSHTTANAPWQHVGAQQAATSQYEYAGSVTQCGSDADVLTAMSADDDGDDDDESCPTVAAVHVSFDALSFADSDKKDPRETPLLGPPASRKIVAVSDCGQSTSKPSQDGAPQPDIVCKTHGKICTKKLCLDYSQQVREARRAAQEQARLDDAEKGEGSGIDNNRGTKTSRRGRGWGRRANFVRRAQRK